ncbi:MAG TPA: hypothetical protein VE262_19490 [Blastocatellia bacterium]|nr:hypothetical protein [Blastocatellia bacterium]
MTFKRLKFVILATSLAAGSVCVPVRIEAQARKSRARKSPAAQAPAYTPKQHAQVKAEIIKKAEEYKQNLMEVIALLEPEVKRESLVIEKKKALVEVGAVAKQDVEKSEAALAITQAKLDAARKQIGDTDTLIAEVRAEEQLAKMPPVPVGGYRTTSALIRYNGPFKWALADAARVQSYFISSFGRQLPISAYGQTAVHDRMGFDHSNSIDVAVHPDSAEGRMLMNYLRGAGIPFIAFRQAVPGSATGAHIHVGNPSRRIFK